MILFIPLSYRFNMRLTEMDEEKVKFLKKRYGFSQTSELIRYLLTNTYEQTKKEQPLSITTS